MGIVRQATGNFENGGDTDWFRVRFEAGKTYELKTSVFGGGSLLIRVILPDGEVLEFPIPLANYANFVAPVTGDYFISASAFGGGPFYSLTVEDVVDPIPASTATTRELTVDETESVTGNNNIVTLNDDWFAMDLVAGQSYVVASSSIIGKLYVVDSDGEVVAIEGFNGGGGQQVHFTATETGRYYAGAQHFGGTLYDIKLHQVADDHGDTPAGAGSMTVGTPAMGSWEAAGDDDAYAIDLTAGSSYTLAVTNLTSVSVPGIIEVLDGTGAVVWTTAGLGLQTGVFSAAATGTYYISTGIGAVGSPDPMTNAYLNGWSYSLSATALAGDLADNVLTTGVATLGTQFNGSWAVGDRDWIKVELTAGQAYTFTLATGVGGTRIELFDANGDAIPELAHLANSGVPVFHHTAATTGSYFVSVAATTNAGGYGVTVAAAGADDYANNAATTGLVTGGSASGIWEAPNDSDWFAVTLTAGANYLLNTLTSSGILNVRGADGSLLTNAINGDVTFSPTTTGTYYIEAAGGSGAYSFTIATAADDLPENSSTTGVLRQDIQGTSGGDTMSGTADYEHFLGLGGNDLFIAGTGYDWFDGSSGIDTLSYADSAIAIDVDLRFSRSRIAGQFDDLITGMENIIGSAFADSIVGSSLANTLEGGGGDDLLNGDANNDILIGGLGADALTGGSGTDTASYADFAAAVTVNLNLGQGFGNHAQGDTYAGIENVTGSSQGDFIIGDGGANRLDGADGDDSLVGSVGADFLVGGNGTDSASYGDNWGAVFVNLDLGQGFGNAAQGDTYSSIENLTGSIFDDFFIGTLGANRLDGGDGNDTLVGSIGGDTLIGGNGIDTASYEENWGSVFVNLTLGQGFGNAAQGDTYSGIENLKGGVFDDFMIGDEGANRLDGNSGDDILTGSVGADTLVGGNGSDTASYEDNWGGVSVNLTLGQGFGNAAQGDSYESIENLNGSIFDDLFIGDDGANRLAGRLGADTLVGAGGADSFLFDTLLDSGNVDTIADFAAADDTILLDDSMFAGLALGVLAAGAFVIGTAAADGDDRIVYDQATGALLFDADGSGVGAAIQFATLQGAPVITAGDFTVI